MYYRLKNIDTGDCLLAGARRLDIGHTPSCGLRTECGSGEEPRVLASILPRKGGGWILTRRDDSARVALAGRPVGVAAAISPGDEIDIDGTRLRFTVHTDGDYDPAAGVVYRRRGGRRRGILVAIVAVAAIVAAAALLLPRPRASLREADLDALDASLYRIVADSVYLLRDSSGIEIVVAAIEPDTRASGTAFLTADSLLVTARHCIEPWIGDEEWDGTPGSPTLSAELALAIEAETANRLAGREIYRVRTRCVLTSPTERHELYSTDFDVDRSRDQVVCLGTDARPMYMRSIVPLAHRSDMELGDVAVMAFGAAGALHVASADELRAFDASADREIAVAGFPVTDSRIDTGVSRTWGNSQHIDFSGRDGTPAGCIQMSAAVNAGNSGGPVLALIDGEPRVVGLVSKADRRSTQGTFWAVPATEIHSAATAQPDTLIFRR